MLRIAVLDDEACYRQKIKDVTDKTMFRLGCEHTVKVYTDVGTFLSDLKEGCYFDVYLLDVDMPQMSGLEVARHIRREYMEPLIIYITNYTDYAIEAFEVNAYRYIPKRVIETKLPEAYQAILAKNYRASEQVFTIRSATDVERIPCRDIYYLKKEGKYVLVVHKRGQNRVRLALAEVLKELNSSEFLMIDRSYVVNMNHVMSLRNQQVILKDDIALPISKPRFGQVREAFVNYWGDK